MHRRRARFGGRPKKTAVSSRRSGLDRWGGGGGLVGVLAWLVSSSHGLISRNNDPGGQRVVVALLDEGLWAGCHKNRQDTRYIIIWLGFDGSRASVRNRIVEAIQVI